MQMVGKNRSTNRFADDTDFTRNQQYAKSFANIWKKPHSFSPELHISRLFFPRYPSIRRYDGEIRVEKRCRERKTTKQKITGKMESLFLFVCLFFCPFLEELRETTATKQFRSIKAKSEIWQWENKWILLNCFRFLLSLFRSLLLMILVRCCSCIFCCGSIRFVSFRMFVKFDRKCAHSLTFT